MAMKRGLALAVAFGALAMGCEDDRWYDNWYTATPQVDDPDPSYDGSADFSNAFADVGFLGCLNSTADADFIEAFGYDPAEMPENFYLWYGYLEFLGVSGDTSTMTVHFTDPETGAPAYGESIYTDYGGSGGAGFGAYVASPSAENPSGVCDYLAADGTEDGAYLFCDYFYSDNLYVVDSCDGDLPTAFQYLFQIQTSGGALYTVSVNTVE